MVERGGSEVGPEQRARVELRVGGLPDQEVAQSRCSPPVRITRSGSGMPAVYSAPRDRVLVDLVGRDAARGEAPERIDDLRPAGVVEGDVELQPRPAGGRRERRLRWIAASRPAVRRAGRGAGRGRPARASSSVSLRIACSSRPKSPATSSSERAQFSRLKAYSESIGTPRRTTWRRSVRIASTPAAWPSSSARWCRRAQRRLPSMMIATWCGRSSGAHEQARASRRRLSGRCCRRRRGGIDAGGADTGRRVGRSGQRRAGH